MAQELNLGKAARYERFSRLFIVVLILGTVAVELSVPVVAWWWWRQPFPGLLFQQTLVVSGIHNQAWGVQVPVDESVCLVAIDDQAVTNSRELGRILRGLSPGEQVRILLIGSLLAFALIAIYMILAGLGVDVTLEDERLLSRSPARRLSLCKTLSFWPIWSSG